MQIHVAGTFPVLTDQIRAYAEYRLFSRIAPLASGVTAIMLILTRDEEPGETVCAVSAEIEGGDNVRAQTRHRHPTAAIDLAAERLAAAVRRRQLAARMA